MAVQVYDFARKADNECENVFQLDSKTWIRSVKVSKMLYCMKERRYHVKPLDIFCDMHAWYSESLQYLRLEEIVFEGLEVSADKKSIKTPPVSPLLFVYFLACSETKASELEKFFSPR